MGTNRLTQLGEASPNGFSLVEVMVSFLFLTVASLALLQGFELAFRHYSLAQNRWKVTIELWNRIEQLRANPPTQEEALQIFPGARPLYRTVVSIPGRAEHSGWEVLRAEK